MLDSWKELFIANSADARCVSQSSCWGLTKFLNMASSTLEIRSSSLFGHLSEDGKLRICGVKCHSNSEVPSRKYW